jgi:hypothetical protein
MTGSQYSSQVEFSKVEVEMDRVSQGRNEMLMVSLLAVKLVQQAC